MGECGTGKERHPLASPHSGALIFQLRLASKARQAWSGATAAPATRPRRPGHGRSVLRRGLIVCGPTRSDPRGRVRLPDEARYRRRRVGISSAGRAGAPVHPPAVRGLQTPGRARFRFEPFPRFSLLDRAGKRQRNRLRPFPDIDRGGPEDGGAETLSGAESMMDEPAGRAVFSGAGWAGPQP